MSSEKDDEVYLVDSHTIYSICVAYARTVGRLILMRDCGGVDQFWGDDVQELINLGVAHRDTVEETMAMCQEIEVKREALSAIYH